MSLTSHPDPVRQETPAGPHETLAEPVFAGLLKDWHTLGCARTTGETPVNAASLSEVLGQLSGAADRGHCPRGTGWPARASA